MLDSVSNFTVDSLSSVSAICSANRARGEVETSSVYERMRDPQERQEELHEGSAGEGEHSEPEKSVSVSGCIRASAKRNQFFVTNSAHTKKKNYSSLTRELPYHKL